MSAAPGRRTGEDELTGPWRWVAWPLEFLVRVYQLVISPILPPSCRFYPSCSAYSLTALRRFGPLWGTWLTIARLARCHPWNPGGVDHVPRRGPGGAPVRHDGGRSPESDAAPPDGASGTRP